MKNHIQFAATQYKINDFSLGITFTKNKFKAFNLWETLPQHLKMLLVINRISKSLQYEQNIDIFIIEILIIMKNLVTLIILSIF